MNKWGQEQIFPTENILAVKLTRWWSWIHFGIDITEKLNKKELKEIKQKWRSDFPTTLVAWLKYSFWNHLTRSWYRDYYPGVKYVTPVLAIKRARFFYLVTKIFRPEKNVEKNDFLQQVKKVKKKIEMYKIWMYTVFVLIALAFLFNTISIPLLIIFEFPSSVAGITLVSLNLFFWAMLFFSIGVLYGFSLTVRFSIFNLPNEIATLFFPRYHGKICTGESGEVPSGLLQKRKWWMSPEGIIFNLLPTNKKLWRHIILHIDLILCSDKKIMFIHKISEKYKNFSYKMIKADEDNLINWVYKEEPLTEEQVTFI